jgi:hypothetical protein
MKNSEKGSKCLEVNPEEIEKFFLTNYGIFLSPLDLKECDSSLYYLGKALNRYLALKDGEINA